MRIIKISSNYLKAKARLVTLELKQTNSVSSLCSPVSHRALLQWLLYSHSLCPILLHSSLPWQSHTVLYGICNLIIHVLHAKTQTRVIQAPIQCMFLPTSFPKSYGKYSSQQLSKSSKRDKKKKRLTNPKLFFSSRKSLPGKKKKKCLEIFR